MEHYLSIRIVHAATAILLVLGVIVHLLMLWKAARRAEPGVLQRKLERTRRLSLPLLALLGLSLPLTGWWLVSLAGYAPGQLWLIASSLLVVALIPLTLLLAGRLGAWQVSGNAPASARAPRFALLYAGLILLVLVASMGLMGAKPV